MGLVLPLATEGYDDDDDDAICKSV